MESLSRDIWVSLLFFSFSVHLVWIRWLQSLHVENPQRPWSRWVTKSDRAASLFMWLYSGWEGWEGGGGGEVGMGQRLWVDPGPAALELRAKPAHIISFFSCYELIALSWVLPLMEASLFLFFIYSGLLRSPSGLHSQTSTVYSIFFHFHSAVFHKHVSTLYKHCWRTPRTLQTGWQLVSSRSTGTKPKLFFSSP